MAADTWRSPSSFASPVGLHDRAEPPSIADSRGSGRGLAEVGRRFVVGGVALGLVRFLAGTIVVCRAIQRGRRVEDEEWLSLLAEASGRLGVRRKVDLRRTDAVAVPVVWGWRTAVVLIPVTSESWPLDQRRAFLLHELAHVARRDCLAQALASVAHAVYWPHPLVWWAVRRLRAEAERACDDLVLQAGTDAPEYAQHLLDAARALRNEHWLPAGSSVVRRADAARRPPPRPPRPGQEPAVRHLAIGDSCRRPGGCDRRRVGALQPAARAAAVEAVRAAIAPLVEKVAPGVPGKVAAPAIPKAESALTGTVRGPDGRPVGGALVIVKPSLESVQPSTVTTAADGRFRLPLPTKQAGPWDVVIEAKGLAAQESSTWLGAPR